MAKKKWSLKDEEKKRLIKLLDEQLASLRAKANISQNDLAMMIGVSRQTYGAIERGIRSMTWNTYLSLILFFDYNANTHDILRTSGAFPTSVMEAFNRHSASQSIHDVVDILNVGMKGIAEKLDEQALQSIRTMIMVEYARCCNLSGDAVVKLFNGVTFSIPTADSVAVEKAVKGIARRRGRPRKNSAQ